MAGLFEKLTALDRRDIQRSIEASSKPTVRQLVVFGTVAIVVGAGLMAWVVIGGGPRFMFGSTGPPLGMGGSSLIWAMLRRSRRKSSAS